MDKILLAVMSQGEGDRCRNMDSRAAIPRFLRHLPRRFLEE